MADLNVGSNPCIATSCSSSIGLVMMVVMMMMVMMMIVVVPLDDSLCLDECLHVFQS